MDGRVAGVSCLDEPMTTEAMTEEPMTTEPMTTEAMTEEPMTTEPMTTEAMTEEPMTSEPMTTEPMTTEPMTTGTIGTTKTTSASEPSTCPHGWLDAAHIGCFFLLQNVTVNSWCAKFFSLNILLCSGTKPTWSVKIWEDSLWNQRLKRFR